MPASNSKVRLALLAVGGCVGALAVWGLAPWGARPDAPAGAPPNVLFLVLDSVRADRLGTYGSTRRLTPFLDELARGSLVYERAYAPSSWTMPTVASLFLGRSPSQHGVVRFFTAIRKTDATLAGVFAAQGYATSGVTANATTTKTNHFDTGFERYELVGKPTIFDPKSDGALLNEAILRIIDTVGGARPHFIYAHYMDVHAPYREHPWTAPRAADLRRPDQELNLGVLTGAWMKEEEQRRARWTYSAAEVRRLEQLYDGEVRRVDSWLADLFAALEQRGFLANAIVVVTADHGEEFGEHGVFYHGVSLYEEAIHVPLLIRLPDRRVGRIAEPVQLAGLGAALFGELGIAVPPGFLVPATPLVAAPPRAPIFALSELVDTKQMKIWLHEKAVMGRHAKLLVTSAGEQQTVLLDGEHAGAAAAPAQRDELVAALGEFAKGETAARTEAPRGTLDAATIERLRGLGYFPEAE